MEAITRQTEPDEGQIRMNDYEVNVSSAKVPGKQSMVQLYNSVNPGPTKIGTRESMEDTRENTVPISDGATIFETMDLTIVDVAMLIAPTDKPG